VMLRYSRRMNAGIFNLSAMGAAIERSERRLFALDWV
jgi:hypothetical protein